MDLQDIAEIIRTGGSEQTAAAYDRLKAEIGESDAGALWDKACAEVDHESAVAASVHDFAAALNSALRGVTAARTELGRLTAPGAAWHPDYAEGDLGADLARLLDGAARSLRLAVATNPGPERK